MGFWGGIEARLRRLAGQDVSDAEFRRLSDEGQQLEQAAKSGGWETIWALVLLPLREDAQKKLNAMDPTDFSGIAQYQKLIQAVDEIPKIIEKKVRLGREALKTLAEQYAPTLKEGE